MSEKSKKSSKEPGSGIKRKGIASAVGRFFRSFSLSIFLYLMIFTIAPVTVLNILDNYYFGNIISETELGAMQTQAAVIADEMKSYESLDAARSAGQFSNYSQLASINEMRIRIVDNNFKILLDTYEFDSGKTIINENVVKIMQGQTHVSDYVRKNTLIESAVLLRNNSGEKLGVLLLSRNVSRLNRSLQDIHNYSNLITVAIVLTMAVFAGFLAKKFKNRYNNINSSIAEIAGGKIDKRLKEDGYTEYRDLFSHFNEILDNARELDASREEFVSNVSHELKTPMTSMKLLADSLLADPNTPVEMYREFMQDIASEIDRENGIIEDLLSLVRMDRSVSTLNISDVNINELVEKVLKKLTPIANRKNIELVFESIRPVEAQVDEIKITQVVTNLVENAIKYNKEEGYVHVSLNADYEFFYLRVEDNGIGIPAEDQKNVFQRFYRVDKARSRESGGTGLGLSIVKSIILMHNGQIKLYSEPENEQGEGGMTVFTVKMPLKRSLSSQKGTDHVKK